MTQSQATLLSLVNAASQWRRTAYVGSAGRHEDGEVREVVAGAGGGVAADVERLAAVGGPAALQAVRRVLPEGALGRVNGGVDWLRGSEKQSTRSPFRTAGMSDTGKSSGPVALRGGPTLIQGRMDAQR